MLNPEFKTKWLTALRSGEYAQCRKALTRTSAEGKSYCCIGVAGAVAGYTVSGDWDRITRPDGTDTGGYGVMDDFGLTHDIRSTLVSKNDTYGDSFSQIADFIERSY